MAGCRWARSPCAAAGRKRSISSSPTAGAHESRRPLRRALELHRMRPSPPRDDPRLAMPIGRPKPPRTACSGLSATASEGIGIPSAVRSRLSATGRERLRAGGPAPSIASQNRELPMRISRFAGRPSAAGFTLIEADDHRRDHRDSGGDRDSELQRLRHAQQDHRRDDAGWATCVRRWRNTFSTTARTRMPVCAVRSRRSRRTTPIRRPISRCPARPPLSPPTTYTIQVDGRAARGMTGFTYTVDQANQKSRSAFPRVGQARAPPAGC